MTGPDPESAVRFFYEIVANPTVAAIEACVAEKSLERLREHLCDEASALQRLGDRERLEQFFIEHGHRGTLDEYRALTGADLLLQLITLYPPHIRQFAPRILGTIREKPDQAWVFFRLECLPPGPEGSPAARTVDDPSADGDYEPFLPDYCEARLIDGRWQVMLNSFHDHPVPGLRGTILWSEP